MTERERVLKTLRFESVDRAPRDLWYPIGIEMFRRTELEQVMERYPKDFVMPDFAYGESGMAKGDPGVGEYVDGWGCLWVCGEPGVTGEVKRPALPEWSGLDSYRLPWEMLREADLTRVNSSCAGTDKFTLVCFANETRPFERMQFLRGTENLFVDLAYGSRELYRLRDMLHEFYLEEMGMWAKTDIDGLSLDDDWGTQVSMLISPDKWREFFKPMYRDYCDILHAAGKFVFMHSDGNIAPILPDLIEIGVDAINAQLFCMDLEQIAEDYAGKITFWGEIDQQRILPFGSTEEVRAAVRRVKSAFSRCEGGVIAQCSWGLHDPKENIEAVFSEWDKE